MKRSGYVVGFDLSLTAPASVALPIGWKPGDWKSVKTSLLKVPAPGSDDLRGQLERYAAIAHWAFDVVAGIYRGPAFEGAVDVFRESYGFRQNTASGSRLMESGGIVVHELYRKFKIATRPVAASTARKFLLGFNPSKRTGHDAKVAVHSALWKAGAPLDRKLVEKWARWKARGASLWGEDVCDAFVVANWGLTEVGCAGLTVAQVETKKR